MMYATMQIEPDHRYRVCVWKEGTEGPLATAWFDTPMQGRRNAAAYVGVDVGELEVTKIRPGYYELWVNPHPEEEEPELKLIKIVAGWYDVETEKGTANVEQVKSPGYGGRSWFLTLPDQGHPSDAYATRGEALDALSAWLRMQGGRS